MKTGTTGRWMLLAALGAVLIGSAAFGQSTTATGGANDKKDDRLKPPTPSKPDEPPVVMTIIGGIVVVGLMSLAALIPSKRGHQD